MTNDKKMSVKHSKAAGMTNKTKDSVVKVIVRSDDRGDWIRPKTGEKFYIDEEAVFPDIEFEFKSDVPGPYRWTWTMKWPAQASGLSEKDRAGDALRLFEETGKFAQDGKRWNARSISQVIGGTLRVVVQVGEHEFTRTVEVLAKQPGAARIKALIAEHKEPLLEKIVQQESRFKHVIEKDFQPVVASDKGFGAVQLTKPKPTYSEVWSWRENVLAGVRVLREKRRIAKAHLSQRGRKYTQEMLDMETICLWNAGLYYDWDENAEKWVRNKTILCDSNTGNIGWDMRKTDNKDKTEKELRERDQKTYNIKKSNRSAGHEWRYSGVCYADHVQSN